MAEERDSGKWRFLGVFGRILTVVDWHTGSGTSLFHDLYSEPFCLGPSFQHRHSIWHFGCPPGSVAARSASPGLRRQLVRLREGRPMVSPSQDQHHPSSDPGPTLVYEEHSVCAACRPSSFCRNLHRTALRLQESVARQERVLLCLRLLGRSVLDSDHHGCGGHDCCYLQPVVLRGKSRLPEFATKTNAKVELPLVVAVLLRWRRLRALGFPGLHMVLLLQVTHYGIRVQHALLRLQLPRLSRLWPPYWHHWFPGRVCLCA